MKYNKFSKKGQEDRSHLLADVLGGILWEDAYTSVVTPLPTITMRTSFYEPNSIFRCMSLEANQLGIRSNHIFCHTIAE